MTTLNDAVALDAEITSVTNFLVGAETLYPDDSAGPITFIVQCGSQTAVFHLLKAERDAFAALLKQHALGAEQAQIDNFKTLLDFAQNNLTAAEPVK